jgi:hypothetical protein
VNDDGLRFLCVKYSRLSTLKTPSSNMRLVVEEFLSVDLVHQTFGGAAGLRDHLSVMILE